MVNQRTLTHAHQEALHSSLFVSYLYNYFKVSTDFGFPFREKTIKPCSPGLSGESVITISLHGAVAGTVAPRAHTALRACNLRLKLPTLLSFINNGELFSAQEEVNIQDTSLTFFNIFNNCFAGSLQKVSAQTFIFSPFKEILLAP